MPSHAVSREGHEAPAERVPVLAVHGGAGAARAGEEFPEREVRRHLEAAVESGFAQMREGADAACVAAVAYLEDCPLFNAGTGSALAEDGSVWCDAAVMRGDGSAGAVACVEGIRHPVRAADALMRLGGPTLWAGRSDELAAAYGLETIAPSAMVTERQRRRLAAHRRGEDAEPFGTVGAVALDGRGRLAAATSTGGQVGKRPARVGDSPLVGAGTWAADATCAVSASGDGEAFMRVCFGHEVDARMRLGLETLSVAAGAALDQVAGAGGRGGAICLDASGTLATPMNAEIFARAYRHGDGPTMTAVSASAETWRMRR